MKPILYTLLLLLLPTILPANHATPHKVVWKGVEKWQVDSVFSREVISVQNAIYVGQHMLPAIEHEFAIASYVPQIVLKHATYVEPTAKELELLEGAVIPETIQVNQAVIAEGEAQYLSAQILPFIQKEGKVLKLDTYELTHSPSNRAKATRSALHRYASKSVLASGSFIKIRISDTGIYRLTYEDLLSMGITSPADVRIFGYGGAQLNQDFRESKPDDLPEVAIYMHKGSDNVFNAGDYILFYAQGIISWRFDGNYFVHTKNTYSNHGYYFVTSEAGTGKRIESRNENLTGSSVEADNFMDYQVHENDLVNLLDAAAGKEGGGRDFYGENFNAANTTRTFSFTFPNVTPSASIRARIKLAAASSGPSSFRLTLNDNESKTVSIAALRGDNYTKAVEHESIHSFASPSDVFNFQLRYAPTATVANGYLGYLALNVRRELIMSGNVMFFRNTDNVGNIPVKNYRLRGANTQTAVWNITDPANIFEVQGTLNNGTYSFLGANGSLQQYVAVELNQAGSLPKPTVIGRVANQNLHALSDIDYVIITHPDFVSAAQQLANAHETMSRLTTAVVTTDQVYNEFSSGTPDATAYRWLMKMLYDRANNSGETIRPPQYLLLFGKGTFDNRKILPNSGENKVLTYQAANSVWGIMATAIDDYFGFLKDTDGLSDTNDRLELGIGRLPAVTPQQAQNMVNKTIRYMQNGSAGSWKNQICFLGDDGDGAQHMRDADSAAELLLANFPSYSMSKIYLDAYQQEMSASGESYPIAKNRLDNLLRKGVLYFNYCGHGSLYGIANEGMMTIREVRSMTNANYALWTFGTCNFSQWDGHAVSAGEEAVLNPNGGALGIFSAARIVYAAPNARLNRNFTTALFAPVGGEHVRVGDAVRIAKNKDGNDRNKLSFLYLGDPAVKLHFPTTYNVVTSSINGKETSAEIDTLRALSVNTVRGYIEHPVSKEKDSSVNGTVSVTVYDKEQSVITLNNHKEPTNNGVYFSYRDRPNVLFSGEAHVVNGEFSITFMLPKDIRYNYGSGSIVYYVHDQMTGAEGQGSFMRFMVGGSNAAAEFEEEEGPGVTIYLNSPYFKNGDKVDERPTFFATMSDNNGINTVGSGIGHDLLLTIDNDPQKMYILNDYFTASLNSYQSGSISYKLPKLAEGKHTLTFRAWDLLNNSTTATLDFEVVANLEPTIFKVLTYPNPVSRSSSVTIKIDHDRPDEVMEAVVNIFDLNGKNIFSHTQSGADEVVWNVGRSNIQAGIYVYQVRIKTADSEYTSKTNKIIILAQ